MVALHIQEGANSCYPEWNLAFAEVKPIALALGLDLGMHVEAVLDAHRRLVATLDTTAELEAPMDPRIFDSQHG